MSVQVYLRLTRSLQYCSRLPCTPPVLPMSDTKAPAQLTTAMQSLTAQSKTGMQLQTLALRVARGRQAPTRTLQASADAVLRVQHVQYQVVLFAQAALQGQLPPLLLDQHSPAPAHGIHFHLGKASSPPHCVLLMHPAAQHPSDYWPPGQTTKHMLLAAIPLHIHPLRSMLH
jgi:hypothetical protein